MRGVQTKTDADISDEEAGRMRRVLAENSKSRKAAEASSLRAQSAEDRRRVKKTGTRTDGAPADLDPTTFGNHAPRASLPPAQSSHD